jgi:polyhydroxyalkanoate synthesis repressor PhaR
MRSPRRPTASAADAAAKDSPRILKKYPNRRLYDTRSSSYITLVDVKRMVLAGEDFEVRDAKSGDELTRSILLQIILEEESGGVPMFSTAMLSQIIRFYGHSMQGMMGAYLEKNLQNFIELQARFVGQGKPVVEPVPLTPEAWTKMMGAQAPMMQALMTSYAEQSKTLIETMREQMEQAGTIFPGMPGFPPTKR